MASLIGAAVGAVAVLATIVLLCERILRPLLRRGGYYVWLPGLKRILSPDAITHPQLEKVVRFYVNSDGERGNEVGRGQRSARFRILVVGGSAVECYLLDQDTCWTGQLESTLNSAEHLKLLGVRHVHVGAIGKSGIDSAALDLVLERVLHRYTDIDAIILMFGASDVLRWLAIGAPPDSAPERHSLDQCFAQHPEQLFRWHPKRTAIVEVGRRFHRRLYHRPQYEKSSGKWIGRARDMRSKATEVRCTVPSPAMMLSAFTRNSRRLLVRARQHARHVLVVRQPWFEKCPFSAEEKALLWSGGVGNPFREYVSSFYSDEVLFDLMAQLDEQIVVLANELNVPSVNLMPHLEMSARTFIDHFHFTPLGSKAIASKIADALLAEINSR